MMGAGGDAYKYHLKKYEKKTKKMIRAHTKKKHTIYSKSIVCDEENDEGTNEKEYFMT